MSIVSNSSPLIALASIDSLDLLHALYGIVHFPEAVYQEVVVSGAGRRGATTIANTHWIVRHGVKNRQTVAQLQSAGLNQGESEAVALALELSANLLIVDEYDARSIARQRGIAITGAVGVLIAAKNAGIVAAIKPLLSQLLAAGFYISPQIIADALHLAGE